MADFKGAADFYNPKPDHSAFLKPWAQNSHRYIVFNVRTSGDPRAVKETVRKALGRLAPNVAANELRTVREVKDSEVRVFTFMRKTLLWTSFLGLLLAAVGIYGVVAQIESERTREIGIRMALGAQPAGLVWLFLRNGIVLALVGAAVGTGASLSLINFLSKTLPNLPGNDPGVVAAVAGILMAVAVLACWLPARRATRVSPLVALRTE
jgi:ABC-type lipoprotein release transport system permease subunit